MACAHAEIGCRLSRAVSVPTQRAEIFPSYEKPLGELAWDYFLHLTDGPNASKRPWIEDWRCVYDVKTGGIFGACRVRREQRRGYQATWLRIMP
jgi:hypothetical protein